MQHGHVKTLWDARRHEILWEMAARGSAAVVYEHLPPPPVSILV